MKLFAPQSSYAAKKDDLWSRLCGEIDDLASLEAVEAWWMGFQLVRLRHLPPVFQSPLQERLEGRRSELVVQAKERALDREYARAMERD